MLGMRWDQVDLGEGLIYLDPEDQKNGRPGSVPLNAEARAALVARAQFKARFCPDSPWVFCHQDGSRVASIKKGFQNACERAGITDLVPHDLRHTCAAWLVQAGVPLTEVRDLLRHSSVRVTERYAHLAPHRVRAAVQHLEGASSRLRHGEDEEGGTGSG
jgi:integrase